MVVDDDLTMIRLLEERLTNDGHKVIVASDGEMGLRRAKEERPDCILVDLMLPGISGVQMTRGLKDDQATSAIPLVFITAYMGVENDRGDETIEIDGERYPAFAKPLHQPKILSVIRKEINRRRFNSPRP